MLPDDNNSLDLLGLYTGISNHAFDELDPFVPPDYKSIRVQVGKSQLANDYQDIPLCVKVSAAAQTFGICGAARRSPSPITWQS